MSTVLPLYFSGIPKIVYHKFPIDLKIPKLIKMKNNVTTSLEQYFYTHLLLFCFGPVLHKPIYNRDKFIEISSISSSTDQTI